MTYIPILIIVLLLAYHAWKDREHQRHIERLELLVKSKDVAEFVMSQPVVEEEPELEADESVPLEEATPEEVLQAITKSDQPEA